MAWPLIAGDESRSGTRTLQRGVRRQAKDQDDVRSDKDEQGGPRMRMTLAPARMEEDDTHSGEAGKDEDE